jgi:hypothetical protein
MAMVLGKGKRQHNPQQTTTQHSTKTVVPVVEAQHRTKILGEKRKKSGSINREKEKLLKVAMRA